jgi:hypothetical protein
MISEARKKAVKAFNRRLKKATGLEKETLLAFVQEAGQTASGNLSTKAIVSTQTIKSFARSKKSELPKKLTKYRTPVTKRKKLTPRERLEREQQFRERHGLQYTSQYQEAERLLSNPLASEKAIKRYAVHTKVGSEEYLQQKIESRINKIRYFAYREESTNADAQRMVQALDDGLRKLDKDDLNKLLDDIESRNKTLIEDYEKDLDIGGVAVIPFARE